MLGNVSSEFLQVSELPHEIAKCFFNRAALVKEGTTCFPPNLRKMFEFPPL